MTKYKLRNSTNTKYLIINYFYKFLKIINFINMTANHYLVNKEFNNRKMKPLTNQKGEVVEKYLPRKCCASSKLIGPKDHASVQIFIPDVDENGRMII